MHAYLSALCYCMYPTRVCNQLEAENSEIKLKLQRQSKRKTQSESKKKESPVQVKATERSSRSDVAPSSGAQSKRVQELEAANAALKEQVGFQIVFRPCLTICQYPNLCNQLDISSYQLSRLSAPPLPNPAVTDSVALIGQEVEQVR